MFCIFILELSTQFTNLTEAHSIGDVMVGMLPSSMVDCVFDPWSANPKN